MHITLTALALASTLLAPTPQEQESTFAGSRGRQQVDAERASERMESAGVKYQPLVTYPTSELGRKLETIAKLIASGLKSTVYYVRIDGFDTHANQPAAHAALLRAVSDAVSALVRDVEAHGDSERLLVMCFSEFGRRVKENASLGTDHGTAGPVFLAGRGVMSGLHGATPLLTNLVDGDLRMLVDFRQFYAATLAWLGIDAAPVLSGDFEGGRLFNM